VVSKLDLQQGLSLVDSARVTLAQQQRQRAQDLNLLTLLIGQPLPADLAPGMTLAATALGDLPAGLPSDLLTVRPDIRAAEQQLIAAAAAETAEAQTADVVYAAEETTTQEA
jgi:outer membrane protein TolC